MTTAFAAERVFRIRLNFQDFDLPGLLTYASCPTSGDLGGDVLLSAAGGTVPTSPSAASQADSAFPNEGFPLPMFPPPSCPSLYHTPCHLPLVLKRVVEFGGRVQVATFSQLWKLLCERGRGGGVNIREMQRHLESAFAGQPVTDLLGVGKHLCGDATDLSLTSLCDAIRPACVVRVCVVPCCHHRCQWSTFVGKSFLSTLGGFFHSQDAFAELTRITGWATQKGDVVHRQRKRLLGVMAKRILDTARVSWLRERGFTANLVRFVGEEVTPENCVIVGQYDYTTTTTTTESTV